MHIKTSTQQIWGKVLDCESISKRACLEESKQQIPSAAWVTKIAIISQYCAYHTEFKHNSSKLHKQDYYYTKQINQ
jgi:hypothetical protein